MRTPLLVIPLLLLASACTGSDNTGKPEPTPTEINPCEGATPAPGCITSSPATATSFPYPVTAGAISPLPVPDKFDGELARRDNNLNPGVTTTTFTVTIPAGKVIATDVLCQGRGSIAVTTKPVSDGEVTINCDGNDQPSQLGVFASDPVKTATAFTITLKASGPSRWLVAVSARAPQ